MPVRAVQMLPQELRHMLAKALQLPVPRERGSRRGDPAEAAPRVPQGGSEGAE